MKLWFAPLLCYFVCSCFAQVTIKGHHIGETAGDFLKAEPGIQAMLADCHANKPHQISVGEVNQRKFPNGRAKKEYVELARAGRLFDKSPEQYEAKCKTLLRIFDDNGGGVVRVQPADFPLGTPSRVLKNLD